MATNPFDNTIDHLVSRWQNADKLFLRQIFPLLAEGKPVPCSRIVEITGRDILAVHEALKNGRTTIDKNGNVIEVFGISVTPAYHTIQIGEVRLYSCCALVAQMVPLFLDTTVIIESPDPVNNGVVRVRISPQEIHAVEPASAVGILVVTQLEQILDDVRSAFCSHVHYCSDDVSAQSFVAENPKRYVVSIEQFNTAARRLHAAIWE